MKRPANNRPMEHVWDLPTRLFHWLLVSLFLFLLLTGDQGDWLERHMQAGYLLSGLIIFRILWGLVGNYHARFRNFIRSPGFTLQYMWRMVRNRGEHYQGHNPAGAAMVVTLLAGLLLQATSGLVTTDDIFWEGPLYNSVPTSVASLGATIHRSFADVLLALVSLHIVAVLYHTLRYKQPLVPAMIHGKKPVQDGEAIHYGAVSIPKLIIALVTAGAWVGWLFTLQL